VGQASRLSFPNEASKLPGLRLGRRGGKPVPYENLVRLEPQHDTRRGANVFADVHGIEAEGHPIELHYAPREWAMAHVSPATDHHVKSIDARAECGNLRAPEEGMDIRFHNRVGAEILGPKV
jgi:hypothetical protein